MLGNVKIGGISLFESILKNDTSPISAQLRAKFDFNGYCQVGEIMVDQNQQNSMAYA